MPLKPPPRDNDGRVIPHDHDDIQDSDGVIRRISNQQIVVDDKTGGRRISSIAYQASKGANGGMSIDLEASIIEAGHDPFRYVTTPRWFGSVRFDVRFLRVQGLKVGFHPIKDHPDLPDNPHHGEVWGDFSRPQRRALQRNAQWFVAIPDCALC